MTRTSRPPIAIALQKLGRRGWMLGLPLLAVWGALVWGAGEWAARREMDLLADEAQRSLDVQKLSLLGMAERYKHIPYTSSQQNDVIALLNAPTDQKLIDRVDVYLNGINRRVNAEALYLMKIDGECIAASNWNEKEKSFKGEPYDFRPYFKSARSGQLGLDYAVGTTTGKPGLFYASPVQSGDKVYGVMAIKLTLTDIETSWKQAANPIFLMDKRGIVILSSFPSFLYTATRALSESDRISLHQTRQYGVGPEGRPKVFEAAPWEIKPASGMRYSVMSTRIDGRARSFLVKEDHVPEFDWDLLVTADLSAVNQARWIAITIAALSSAALLFGALYWRQRERRVLDLRRSRQELETRVNERTHDLAEAAAFRKAMEDSLLVGMRARDLAGHIIYVNPALCEMTGYRADELMGGLPPYPYWHPDDTEKHWRDNEAALTGQAELTGFESRIRHRDGHDVITMVYTAPLIGADGKHAGWMSSVVDITAQKRADELQRSHVEQIQHAQRKASLGEMASTLAHELSQPLAAMANFASAARAFADQNRTALVVENLDAIKEQAQRAKQVMERIRVPARQQTLGLQACNPYDAIGNVMALLKFEVRQRKARIVTGFTETLPTLFADRILLEQVLMNLIINALQAMQDRPPAQRIVTIRTGTQDGRVFISVADEGDGIADSVASKLFQPFFTTKPDGLGLGLNICRTIVEAHGGRLEFVNGAPRGAIFTVFLPVAP